MDWRDAMRAGVLGAALPLSQAGYGTLSDAIDSRVHALAAPAEDPRDPLVRARTDFVEFIRLVMPEYVFNWHHLHIIRVLERFIAGEFRRLMLFAPPQTGKSQIVSRFLPAYLLGLMPDTSVMCCTYSDGYAGRLNRDVQRIMDSEAYLRIFPWTRLWSKNVRTMSRGTWLRNSDVIEVVGRKGVYRSAGRGSGIAGQPFQWGILDDIVKDAREANSPTVRDSTEEWYDCYHPDTELLTRSGWKPVAEVKAGEDAATLNPETRRMEYRPVTKEHASWFDGELITLWQRLGASFSVTPNHRMLYSTIEDPSLRFGRADELPKNCRLPQWCEWVGEVEPPARVSFDYGGSRRGRPLDCEQGDWLELVGWWVAEGHIHKAKGAVHLSQLSGPGMARIPELLNRIGVGWWKTQEGFAFGCLSMSRYLLTLGHDCYSKRLDPEHKRYSPALLRRLLDGLIGGDGYWSDGSKKRGRYVTASKGLADDVSEVAIKCGYRPTINVTAAAGEKMILGRPCKCEYPTYQVVLRRTSHDTHLRTYRERDERGGGVEKVPYRGMVYCVTVPPYHSVLTRHRGRVLWSGQTAFHTRQAKDASILQTLTRWHEDDLAGRKLRAAEADPRADQWKVIRYQALALERGHPDRDPDDPREPGESLWLSKYSTAEYEGRRASNTPQAWASVYQQTPYITGGGIFKQEFFKEFELVEAGDGPELRLTSPSGSLRVYPAGECTWFQTCDTAQKVSDDAAYTVAETWVITPGGELCLYDVWRQRIEIPLQYGALVGFRDGRSGLRHGPKVGKPELWHGQDAAWPAPLALQAVEDKASGIGLIQQGVADGNPFHRLKADRDKVTRCGPVSVLYQNGMVYHLARAAWRGAYEAELLRFPSGAWNDQVDTAAYAGILYQHEKILNGHVRRELVYEAGPTQAEREAQEEGVYEVGGHRVEWPDEDERGEPLESRW